MATKVVLDIVVLKAILYRSKIINQLQTVFPILASSFSFSSDRDLSKA